MKAVILPGNQEVKVIERDIPKPKPGEVLIKLRSSAICRSDMSLYYGNPLVGGAAAKTGHIIPGHETGGDVIELGEGVTSHKIGDRVAVYVAFGCGRCRYCLSGYYHLCPTWKCLGFDIDGGDADYMAVPAQNCMIIPEGLSYEVGSLLVDNVGVQYSAQKRLNVSGATTMAIFGHGPMGSAGVMMAKARGAKVIAIDVLDSRLEMAESLGADILINSSKEDPIAAVRAATRGEGVDVAMDCSGNGAAQVAALEVARKMGSVGFIGEGSSATVNPSEQFIRKLLNVYGCWIFPIHEFEEAAQFLIDKQIPVEKFITHRFPIEEAADAFRLFNERKTEKAVFVWE